MHWLTFVFYLSIVTIPLLVLSLVFLIKDSADKRFGLISVVIVWLGIMASFIVAFSIGYIFAFFTSIVGVVLLMLSKEYRASLLIAVITVVLFSLGFLTGIQFLYYIFLAGCVASVISFIFELIKYRKETNS